MAQLHDNSKGKQCFAVASDEGSNSESKAGASRSMFDGFNEEEKEVSP